MTCFRLFGQNLVGQATITASSENALFPLTNLLDNRRTKVFRSISNSSNIVLDFNEASEIDGVFIIASSSGFGITSVTVEFNGTSDFTSPAFSIAVPLSTDYGLGFIEFAKINYRFCRIVMTSTLGYCELAKVYIGSKLALSKGASFGWTSKDEDLSTRTRNRKGQIFTDTIGRQRSLSFGMKLLTKDDLELIEYLLDYAGETKPIFLTIGDDTMSADYLRNSGAFFVDDVPSVTNSYFNKYNLSFAVKEMV